MEEKYSNKEILEAVNFLLKEVEEKKVQIVPVETEKIISEAEKYLKNN